MAGVLLRSYMDCSGCVLLLSVCTMDEHLSRWQVVLGFAQVLPLRKWWSSWLELSCWNCWKYDSVCFTETLCTEEILFWDCKTRCVTSVQSFPLVLPPPNLTWQKHQFWLSIFCFSRRVLFSRSYQAKWVQSIFYGHVSLEYSIISAVGEDCVRTRTSTPQFQHHKSSCIIVIKFIWYSNWRNFKISL